MSLGDEVDDRIRDLESDLRLAKEKVMRLTDILQSCSKLLSNKKMTGSLTRTEKEIEEKLANRS